MTILLLGKDGQVGRELQRALAPLGTLVALGRNDADFTAPARLREIIKERRPSVVVNAAAYTAVDRAETEAGLARAANCDAVAEIACGAAAVGALFVHYSTDYVFDGTKREPYTEDDAANPVNVYGRTKLGGEVAIRASVSPHLILRTSWVFGQGGANFPATILRLARERAELGVVGDQVGAPTSAELIANVTARLLLRGRDELDAASGTYHLCAAGETSWHGYAQHVVERALALGADLQLRPERIRAIATSEYPTAAARPANSRLSTDRLATRFDIRLPDWRVHLERWLEHAVAGSQVSDAAGSRAQTLGDCGSPADSPRLRM